MHLPHSLRWWPTALVSLALVGAAGLCAYQWIWRTGLVKLQEMEALHQDLIARDLRANLARFDYLPALLETSPAVMQLLQNPDDQTLQNKVNDYLYQVNATAGAELLYLTNNQGLAIAADDAKDPGTPFHSSFAFRPYVREALAKGHGRFFGIGITTGRPGFYLSYALPSERHTANAASAQPTPAVQAAPPTRLTSAPQGIAVVKIGFKQVEQGWANLSGEVIVTDENGVVVLTTKDAWRYQSLRPLSAQAQAKIAQTRAYPASVVKVLDWRELSPLDAGSHRVRINGQNYLGSQRSLESGLFNIIVLEETGTLQSNALLGGLAAGLAALVVCLLWTGLGMRKRSWQEKLTNQAALQAAHDNLEHEVLRRTQELQTAQKELVHAEKMAALGQMSTALAHEINQPLAAMRTLSDNALVFQQQGRHEVVAGNLSRITHLVDRLAGISQRLKIVAHKSNENVQSLDLQESITEVLQLLEERLARQAIEVQVCVTPAGLSVLAIPIPLEQVLTNLIGNAVDAIEAFAAITGAQAPTGSITIHANVHSPQQCRIVITDNGTGIDAKLLPRLFEPFATTKRAGKGLGLGLSLSAQLVKEMGGTLHALNVAPHGARFIIALGCTDENPAGTASERG